MVNATGREKEKRVRFEADERRRVERRGADELEERCVADKEFICEAGILRIFTI